MNLSVNWLNDFVDIKTDPKDFADKMTMSGSKVEMFDNIKNHISNVVVGKITKIERHPNAEKLVICQVDIGGESRQIITGADNVFEGALVPVCLDGAVLPDGKTIKKGKLRGELSEGMLCSLGELGLTAHNFPSAIENGIFIIDFPVEIGQDIVDALQLNDDVFEFEITPNRPDCLSVIGLAREVAATYRLPFKNHTPKFSSDKSDRIENYLSVEIKNPELCPRYTARIAKNIKIAPSPLWLRNRLHSCGVRPINNIVDITNYVMLEYGQPMHAFDYACLDGKAIVVRNADDNEIFMTLDNQQRKLDSSMLVIADAEKSVGIAGVMGGANSEITENTKTVVFESANFNGANVRRTSKKLGMRTDASSKFEKGLDPCMTMAALDRACELVELLEAGEIADGVIDINMDTRVRRTIKLEPAWVNKFLGTDISSEFMVNALRSLQFEIDDELNVTVPSFRDDVEEKADLAEEIVRMYGYNEIPSTLVNMETTQGMLTKEQSLMKNICQSLIAQGASEICTYSFVSPKIYDKLHYPKNDIRRDSVVISNPLGEDTSIMRTTSVASMLSALALNYNNRNEAVCMFEPATVYIKRDGTDVLPEEKVEFCIGAYGGGQDFFDMKGIVEQTLNLAGVIGCKYIRQTDNPTFHPGRTADIVKDDSVIGIIGQIHPDVCKEFDLCEETYVAVLDFNVILTNSVTEKSYKPLPKFPATARDIAVVCKKDISVAQIEDIITENSGNILESVELFDVYSGKQIPNDCISLAFALTYRAVDRTLSDEEIDAKMKKIIKALTEIGASIRS